MLVVRHFHFFALIRLTKLRQDLGYLLTDFSSPLQLKNNDNNCEVLSFSFFFLSGSAYQLNCMWLVGWCYFWFLSSFVNCVASAENFVQLWGVVLIKLSLAL